MKATKKILFSSAALVASLGVAVGSTYAWFVSNNTASVDSIQLGVGAESQNLLVAIKTNNVSDSNYKSTLTGDDFDGLFDSTELSAVTYKDGKYVNSNGAEVATTTYAQFTLLFRDTAESYLCLRNGSSVQSVTESDDDTDVAKNYVANTLDSTVDFASTYGQALTSSNTIVARAANAARVSFKVNSGTFVQNSTSTTISDSTKIWSPNEVNVTGADTNVDSTNISNTSERGKGNWKGNLSADYNKVMKGLKEAPYKCEGYSNYIDALKSNSGSETSTTYQYDATSAIVKLVENTNTGYYEAEVTITVWLEGNDGDCLDSIFNDKIKVNLQFVAINAKDVTNG
jgi:hypothetical protein